MLIHPLPHGAFYRLAVYILPECIHEVLADREKGVLVSVPPGHIGDVEEHIFVVLVFYPVHKFCDFVLELVVVGAVQPGVDNCHHVALDVGKRYTPNTGQLTNQVHNGVLLGHLPVSKQRHMALTHSQDYLGDRLHVHPFHFIPFHQRNDVLYKRNVCKRVKRGHHVSPNNRFEGIQF